MYVHHFQHPICFPMDSLHSFLARSKAHIKLTSADSGSGGNRPSSSNSPGVIALGAACVWLPRSTIAAGGIGGAGPESGGIVIEMRGTATGLGCVGWTAWLGAAGVRLPMSTV